MPKSGLTQDATKIWEAGVEAVRADACVAGAVRVRGNRLRVGDAEFALAGIGRIVVVGAGKAGAGMARGLEAALGPRVLREKQVAGCVNVLHAQVEQLSHIALHGARQKPDNQPTPAGVRGARGMLHQVQTAGKQDLVICLISGGGSALLPLPAEGITLADKQRTTRLLQAAGATINEMNAVRKHLSAIKGGQLASACTGFMVTLVISDVVGSPLDVIASGPTVPDPSTFADALHVLKHHGLLERAPERVVNRLRAGASGRLPETPKTLPSRIHTSVIAENRTALDAAAREARRRGYRVVDLGGYVQGEAASWGAALAGMVRSTRAEGKPAKPPVCLLAGGETTVSLGKSAGKGGRNQEIALAARVSLGVGGLRNAVVLRGGTDGEDGPTDAAGGFVDARIARRADRAGREPHAVLAAHDAYPFLEAAGGLLKTGPTGTNVMDLQVVLVGKA